MECKICLLTNVRNPIHALQMHSGSCRTALHVIEGYLLSIIDLKILHLLYYIYAYNCMYKVKLPI